MFIVTYKDLTMPKLKDALEYMGKIPLDVKLSYNIARIVRKVSVAQKNFQEKAMVLLKEHVKCELGMPTFKKDEKGELIHGDWDFKADDSKEQFEKAYGQLLDTNVEIESNKITASSLRETKLPPEIIFPLEPFIDFDI